MRLATWNVNSVQARLPRLLSWLEETRPDVLCLQETKTPDAGFPLKEVGELGYQAALHGTGRWNGVAILSRAGLADVRRGFPGEPGFPDPEARAISATCAGCRVWSVYVPNGRALDSPHLAYKLSWLAALRDALAAELSPDGAGRGSPCAGTSTSPPATGRVGPGRVHWLHPCHPTGTGRPGQPAGPRADRCPGPGAQGRALHLLGLPGRHVPQGHGHAHRPGPGQRGGARRRSRTPTWTGRPARARGRRTTPRSWWTWICPPLTSAYPQAFMVALVSFHRDLRVHDHRLSARRWPGTSRSISGVCLDDRLLHGRHSSGSRTAFLLECLTDLDSQLAGRGARAGHPARAAGARTARAGQRNRRQRSPPEPRPNPYEATRAAGCGPPWTKTGVTGHAHPGVSVVDDVRAIRTGQAGLHRVHACTDGTG